MGKRIVVTGIGAVTAVGIGRAEFWANLTAGKSGISEITFFDTSDYENHRAGEIKNFDASKYVKPENLSNMGRGSHLAIAAAKMAIEDAGLKIENTETIGVSFGTTMGEVNILETADEKWLKNGEAALDRYELAKYQPSIIPSNVAKEFGLRGPNIMIPNACDAGNCAIGYAYDMVKSGRAKKMIAGGSDPFSKIAFVGFNRLGAVSPDFPRPFDKDRRGMMVGEGAAVLVLESLEDAKLRGAPIYAEILGYGLSCDADHMTAPDSGGEGMALAMIRALRNAGVNREEVDYINVHGTGTAGNDAAETAAIKRVFGRKTRVKVSSSKSMLGHTMGAASAIEAAATALAVKNDLAPPTMNVREVDPIVFFDVIPNQAKPMPINIALNNGSAFGGNNASVVFKKYKG